MKDSKQILAVGSIAYDSIKTPKGNRDRILGGSCTYFSIAASYYAQTSIIGVVGEDFDQNSWNLLKKFNINTDCVEVAEGKTFSWGGQYSEDYSTRETLFTNLGVFENFKPKVNIDLKEPILYLGNIQPELQLDVIKAVKSKSLIAADSMNLWIDLSPNKVWDLISKVDIFMLNDEEAIELTGKKDLYEIANDFLKMGPDTVIIKKGAKGSILLTDSTSLDIPVYDKIELFDPTGAGDSFAGGLVGYFSKFGENNLVEAMIHATVTASYTVSDFGVQGLIESSENSFKSRCQHIKSKIIN